MKYLIAICLLVFPASLVRADWPNALSSIVTIGNTNTVGTGVCFQEDKDYIYILTAGHCVNDAKFVWVWCYADGYKSRGFVAEVYKVDYDANVVLNKNTKNVRDLAILRLRKSFLEIWPAPKIIPLAENARLNVNSRIISAGCPGSSWPSLFLGHVTELTEGGYFFLPQPERGRSGSPVFDLKGEKIIGIVIWQTEQEGRAVSVKFIHESKIFFD